MSCNLSIKMVPRRAHRILGCILACLAWWVGGSAAYGQGTYAYRKAITVNQNVGRPVLNDFPVLVSINGDPDLITKVQSSGADIEFKAADGVTKLDFQIDWFNQGSGTLEAWVRVPALAPGANTIYMDYGNAQVSKSPATPCKVWEPSYLGVWHLGENGTGAVNEYLDSSQYRNHGQGGEGDPLFVPSRIQGRIGFAQHFDNADTKYDVVDCGDDALMDVTGNQITLQAWVKHGIVPPISHTYGILSHKGWSDGYSLWVQGNPFDCPVSALCVAFLAQGQTYQLTTNAVVSAGSWHQVVATYDGATMRVYIDGVPDVNTLAKTNNLAPSMAEQDLFIGHGDQPKDKGWSSEWEGEIDEVRISRIARSAEWIATEFDNQSTTCRPASAFCSVGAEVPGSYGVNLARTNRRSIGMNGGILASAGTATTTSGSPTVNFSASLPANVGAGDRLTLDPLGAPEVVYVLSRDSAVQLTLQSASSLSRTVAFEITRAYTSLAAWEQDIGSGGRGGNLVLDDRREIGVLYNDAPFTAGVTIDGSVTDCAHDMVLTSPAGQRHLGVAGTGVVVDNGASATPAIRILDDYVTVEWLEVKGGSGAAADAIEIGNTIGTSNLASVRYNLLHDTGGDGVRLSDSDSVVEISNNVIYETSYGVHFTADLTNAARASVFNNTIYGSNGSGGMPSGVTSDVRQTSVRIDVRNNIAHSNNNGDFGLVLPFERAYFCNPACVQIANGGTVPSATEYLADKTNNFPLAFAVATDYLYLGSQRKFRGLMAQLATQGTGGAGLQWEYWNGATWANLETNGFSNYIGDFQWPGAIYWPDDPLGWATTSVSGSPNLYYVRAWLSSGSYTTTPVEGVIAPMEANMGSRNNLAGDVTATPHSPNSVTTSGVDSVPIGNLNFVSTSAGTEDLHITAGSAAQDVAVDLSDFFTGDIDAGLRTAPWDIGADDVDATTAVELVSFEATGWDGEVKLTWETGSEIDNLGFHVERATADRGPWSRITAGLVPGLGSSPEGAHYRFVDGEVDNGRTYFYRLLDVDTRGVTSRHGPVSATPSVGLGECCRDERAGGSLVVFGNPDRNRLEILSRSKDRVTLELVTEGFRILPGEDEASELDLGVADAFSSLESGGLPVRRSWVEAAAGRKVRISSIETFGESSFDSITVATTESELEALANGTVLPRRLRNRRPSSPRTTENTPVARLVEVALQGDVKKALVELAPLRWDSGRLVLTRKIRVSLTFYGRDRTERVTEDGRARRHRGHTAEVAREVLARWTSATAGLQEVTFEEAFPTRRRTTISVSSLQLTHLGENVAFHVEPSADRFGPGSRLYFLASAAHAVFELRLGSPGETMQWLDGAPEGDDVDFYWQRETREENRYYQAALVDAPDRWLWALSLSGDRKSYSIETDGVAPISEASRLEMWLQGASDVSGVVDHHARVYFNGAVVGEITFDGKQVARVEAEIPPPLLREGRNEIELENAGDTAAPYSMVMLDKFTLTYPRLPLPRGGRLEGTWSRTGTVTVSGGNGFYVLDTTRSDPSWIASRPTTSAGLRVRVEGGHRYLVVDARAVPHPVVSAVSPPRLRVSSLEADYVIIAPREFLDAARPLAQRRRQQGLRVALVSTEDVYSEFGFGEKRPEAIRDFLTYAYHGWRPPSLRYVLLLGDATYDPEDYLGTGVVDRVPVLTVRTSFLWTASDPTYAAVNGDDSLPDIAIGRLPAASFDEAEAMVGKILAYENNGAPLGSPIVLVSDNADAAGDFPAAADRIASSLLASRSPHRIRIGDPATGDPRAEIRAAFDDGSYLVSYLGHGGIHLWASENVFNLDDVRSLEPQSRQPIVVAMNCLNGYFQFPYFDSLAEAMVKAPGKGAVAAFAPSGLSLNRPAELYHEALLEALLTGEHERIGDAVLDAQSRYAATGALPELLSIYHLLGDPALLIRR